MDEAEALCDRVAIINHGRIICIGTPAELCESIGIWAVEYGGGAGESGYRFFSDWDDSQSFLKSLPSGTASTLRKTNLEDVFLELTGREVASTEDVRFRV